MHVANDRYDTCTTRHTEEVRQEVCGITVRSGLNSQECTLLQVHVIKFMLKLKCLCCSTADLGS